MTTTQHSSPADAPADGHAHEVGLGACQDLVNTVELTDGVPEDHMHGPEDAIRFLTSRGLAHEAALRAQVAPDPGTWLGRLEEVRAAMREVWDAAVEDRTVAAEAVDTLNEVLAHAPVTQLRPGIVGIVVGHRHDDADPTGEALARIAGPLVEALARGDTDRFRVCANDGCRWVFEDTSRGGRRRWCDMSSCGNRAKVRRFRSRRRDEPASADAAGEATEAEGT